MVIAACFGVGIDDENVGRLFSTKNSFIIIHTTKVEQAVQILCVMDNGGFVSYERDGIAYQGYEHLFDPEITPSHLPIGGKFIHLMQTVMCFAIVALTLDKRFKQTSINVWKIFLNRVL